MFKEDSVFDSTNAEDLRSPSGRTLPVWRLAIYAFAALMVFQSLGCKNTRQSVALSWRDLVWSRRAYNLQYGNCEQPFGDDFEAGFRAGYEDVSNGGDGYVPALPPESYRGVQYQCEEGAQCVNRWFEGYPAGVAAARKSKVGSYNDVLISRMINSALAQEKAAHPLPQDVPIVGPGSKNLLPPGIAPTNIASGNPSGMGIPIVGPGMGYRTASQSPAAASQGQTEFARSTPGNDPYAAPNPPTVTGSGVDPQGSDRSPSTPGDAASNRRLQ